MSQTNSISEIILLIIENSTAPAQQVKDENA